MQRLLIALFMLALMGGCVSETESEEVETTRTTENAAMDEGKRLRHVVLFKFAEDASEEDIRRVEEAFAALPGKISEIKAFEWGINNSPEGLNQGFTHAFLLTFDSEEGRATYLPHPDHAAFGDLIGPYIEDVLVVDYWAGL